MHVEGCLAVLLEDATHSIAWARMYIELPGARVLWEHSVKMLAQCSHSESRVVLVDRFSLRNQPYDP
jgi:hypothetical protein